MWKSCDWAALLVILSRTWHLAGTALASCAATCACHACSFASREVMRKSARLAYCVLFTLAMVLAWVLRDFAKPLIDKIPCGDPNLPPCSLHAHSCLHKPSYVGLPHCACQSHDVGTSPIPLTERTWILQVQITQSQHRQKLLHHKDWGNQALPQLVPCMTWNSLCAGIVHHAMGTGEPSERWYGQQAVYRVSMGNFVSPRLFSLALNCFLPAV